MTLLTTDSFGNRDDFDPHETLSYRPVFFTALTTMVCLTAAGVGWGMFARLDSAVISHGVVLAESERKTVEHLEGGILDKLLVVPGQHVEQGEIVATLNATQIREQLAQLRADWFGLTFDLWRLAAEEANAPLDPATAPWPEGMEAGERDEMTMEQVRLYDARARAYAAQISSLRHQIDQLNAQVTANTGQSAAASRQLGLWAEERDANAALVAKGATPRQKLLELDRNIATLEGNRDEYLGLASAARENIGRAEADIDTLAQQRLSEIGDQRAKSRRQVEGLASQIRAAEDVLERQNLRAPQSGTVVDIRTRSPGAILGTGKPLMDIVPDTDRLIVEAHIPPDTIDTVHVGRAAKIKLTAYPRARSPVVMGEVIYVSADMLRDEKDGTGYFDVRASIDPESLKALPGITVSSGMPVELAIQTGERRAGEYFLSPLLRRIDNAFHEE